MGPGRSGEVGSGRVLGTYLPLPSSLLLPPLPTSHQLCSMPKKVLAEDAAGGGRRVAEGRAVRPCQKWKVAMNVMVIQVLQICSPKLVVRCFAWVLGMCLVFW